MWQRSLGTPGELEPNTRGAGCVHMLGLRPWQNQESQKHKLSPDVTSRPSHQGSPEPGHTVFHGHHGMASPNPASGKLSFPGLCAVARTAPVLSIFSLYFTRNNIQQAEVLPTGKLNLKPIPKRCIWEP